MHICRWSLTSTAAVNVPRPVAQTIMHLCGLTFDSFKDRGLHAIEEAGLNGIPERSGRLHSQMTLSPGGVDVERGLYAMQYDMRSWHASARLCSPAVPFRLFSL